MIKLTTLAFAALVVSTASMPTLAEYSYGSTGKYYFQQQNRSISRGINQGRITPKEAYRIKKQQRKIRKLAKQFREDGKVSKREKRILGRKISALNQTIRAYSRNDNFKVKPNYWNRYQRSYILSNPYIDGWWGSKRW